jgi:hypothetical protein
MGDFGPNRGEVATHCDGLGDEAVDAVLLKVRREYSGGSHRGNAWKQTVKYLNIARYGAYNR